MKKFLFLAALFCLMTSVNPVNAQLIIRNSGHAEVGASMALQDITIIKNQYVIASDVIAGNSVNSGRTSGDVIVQNGVEYEIEASGTVTLERGFNVEKGATFAVYQSNF